MSLGAVALVALLSAAVAMAATRPGPVDVAAGSRLAAVHRRTRRWRWAGLLLGAAAAAGAVTWDDPLGRGLMLAVPLLALCVLGGVAVGELRVTAPAGTTRVATLEVRRVRDYVPRRLAAVVAAAAGSLAVTLAATTWAGSPDDLGRAGRQLVWQCSAAVTEARGPWPGSFYSVPLMVLVAGGLLLAAFALHRIVRRARQGEDTVTDDALRAQAAVAVTAAGGLLVAAPFAGVAAVAGVVLVGSSCAPGWATALGGALLLLAPAMVALAGWCAALLVAPSGRGARRAVRS